MGLLLIFKVLLGLSIITLFVYLITRTFRKKTSNSQQENGSPPTADCIQLGEGIAVYMPRALTVKMPRELATGNEHYKASIRNLLLQTFELTPADLSEQDAIWREWLELGGPRGREPKNLKELAVSNLKEQFRARAITILLLPDITFSPFEWKEECTSDGWNHLSMDPLKLSALPQNLQHFVAEHIIINVDAILSTEFNEKLYCTLFTYNRYILQLLALLPDSDPMAEKLFHRYLMNDPIGFANMEEASGYNPFEELLHSGIPEKWKWLADLRVQYIIRSEEKGRTTPRYEWEAALPRYMSIIQFCLYSSNFPYGKDLFATQIAFVLGLSNISSKVFIYPSHLHLVLLMLAGDNYKQLRYSVARHATFDTRNVELGSFTVYNTETRAAAEAILAEFGTEDEEMKAHLETLIAGADKKAQEEIQRTMVRILEVDSVVSKMK